MKIDLKKDNQIISVVYFTSYFSDQCMYRATHTRCTISTSFCTKLYIAPSLLMHIPKILNVVPVQDCHLGMYPWKEEGNKKNPLME